MGNDRIGRWLDSEDRRRIRREQFAADREALAESKLLDEWAADEANATPVDVVELG